ncbi:uncharacterized protein LOC101854400, partial [Aplysia californica]|uniref:Uncharacterized protein LOC101854400 n=1 Tax=Aplysia californica TaxID=6500 RepID=A0ABM0ZWL4_APLCA
MSEDAMDTMRGRLEMPGFDSRGVEDLVRALVNLAGDDNIMLPNCTEAGFYDKVQCVASLSNLEEKTCYCADHHGEYISSNIQPYIGYDTCTGPADYRYWNMCSNDLLEPFNETICRHRGECVFNPYEGKICDCLDGYTALFCERQGNDTAEPESMCEMMSEAYRTARQLVLGEYPVVYNSGQWWGYVNMTFMWLFPNSNRTDHGFPREQVVLKPTCNADGSFHPVVCDHDIVTDTRIACYCWGAAGPVIATEAATPELTNCSRLEEACTELEACPNLKCAYGHQRNTLHCPICQCRNPCQDMRCGKGERCVLRKEKYCLIPDSPDKCVTPVCAPVKKPGSCPGHDVTTLGSIIGGGINMYSSIMDDNGRDKDDDDEDLYCDVTCADDADCQGR